MILAFQNSKRAVPITNVHFEGQPLTTMNKARFTGYKYMTSSVVAHANAPVLGDKNADKTLDTARNSISQDDIDND